MMMRLRYSIALACALTSIAQGCGSDGTSEDNVVVGGSDSGQEAGTHPAQADSGSGGNISPNDAASVGSTDAATRSDAGSRDAGTRMDAGPRNDAGTSDAGKDAGNVVVGPGAGQWVLGYYAAYQREMYTPAEIDWSGLTHIVFTRIKTTGGGNLQLDFDVDATNGPALAKDIAQKAHQNGKKALVMLGGAGEGAGIRNSMQSATRSKFISALVAAIDDLGYDGIDLDWEDNIDYDAFIALAQGLRSAKSSLIITVPGMPINPNIGGVDAKIPTLVQSLDRYSVMTYYPATAYAGAGWLSWHNTPLSGAKSTTPVTIEDTLTRLANAGIPKEKLAMGVAFYAICYTGSVTAPNQSTEGGVSIQGGDNDFTFTELFAKGGEFNASYRKWDDSAKVPYLSLPAADKRGCRYVSFDDEESLEAKGAFSRNKGYGGIIIWTINQGWLKNSDKPANALMQALKRGFLD